MLGVIVAILVSAAAINGGDTGGTDEFVARHAWLYVFIVAGAYMISRGLAKAVVRLIRTRRPMTTATGVLTSTTDRGQADQSPRRRTQTGRGPL